MTSPPRPFIFGTNFKMNQTPDESARFIEDLLATSPPADGTQLFVIPSFVSLPAATARRDALGATLWIGAQNMHWASAGAYTGEIAAPMLTAIGVDLVLLGHAERRALFHETDADLRQKVAAALAADLRVLLCVGETAEEKAFGVGAETVARQLKIPLQGLAPSAAARLQIAYEPVWSIGTGGTPASPADVAPIADLIRTSLITLFADAGRAVPILYGGSVDPTNAGIFATVPAIDGLFVGRAAWSVDGFRRVLDAALAARA